VDSSVGTVLDTIRLVRHDSSRGSGDDLSGRILTKLEQQEEFDAAQRAL
jgi:hypothetical protein